MIVGNYFTSGISELAFQVMSSLPGPFLLPQQPVTQNSSWVHALDLTQGESDLLQQISACGDGWITRGGYKQIFIRNTGFCNNPEKTICRKNGRRGSKRPKRQIVLLFVNTQQKAFRDSPPPSPPPPWSFSQLCSLKFICPVEKRTEKPTLSAP